MDKISGTPRGSLESLMTAEEVLDLCPWLWHLNSVWAKGFSSHTGSLLPINEGFLREKIGQWDDRMIKIAFFLIKEGIQQVREVAPLEILSNSRVGWVTNSRADGESTAERIIGELCLPKKTLKRLVANGDIFIPHIVVITEGPVERTTRYLIYQASEEGDPNLIQMIMDASDNFEPRRYRPPSSKIIPRGLITTCPDCQSTQTAYEEGCLKCSNCGWQECG